MATSRAFCPLGAVGAVAMSRQSGKGVRLSRRLTRSIEKGLMEPAIGYTYGVSVDLGLAFGGKAIADEINEDDGGKG